MAKMSKGVLIIQILLRVCVRSRFSCFNCVWLVLDKICHLFTNDELITSSEETLKFRQYFKFFFSF